MTTVSKVSLFASFLLLGTFIAPNKSQATTATIPCSSKQIEIAFLPEDGPYNGMSKDKATLFFRNISHQDCTLPAIPEIQFLDQNQHLLPIVHEKPEEYHFRRFRHKKESQPYLLSKKDNPSQAVAHSILFWISAPVYATGTCLSPRYIELALPHMKWQVPFSGTICGVTETPWYQEGRLKAGDHVEQKYISALKGEPESPKSFKDGEKPIEASSQGQSE